MDSVIIQVRKYRKSVLVQFVNPETGEIIYDMQFHSITAPLSEIIRGIEQLSAGQFGDAAVSWDVKIDE